MFKVHDFVLDVFVFLHTDKNAWKCCFVAHELILLYFRTLSPVTLRERLTKVREF